MSVCECESIKDFKRLKLFTNLTWWLYKSGGFKSRVISVFTSTQWRLLRASPVLLCSLFPLVLQLVISSSSISTFSWPWPRQQLEPTHKKGKGVMTHISFLLKDEKWLSTENTYSTNKHSWLLSLETLAHIHCCPQADRLLSVFTPAKEDKCKQTIDTVFCTVDNVM